MIEWQGSERGVKADSQVSGLEVLFLMVMKKEILGAEHTWRGTKKPSVLWEREFVKELW